jgi:hypothetical protein
MRRAVPVLGRRERDTRRRMRLVSRKPRTAEIEGCTPTSQNACPEGDPDINPVVPPAPALANATFCDLHHRSFNH